MSILKVDEIQDTAGKKILQNTGGILQVVSDTFSGTESSTSLASSGSFTNSSLSASITPTSSSSKILIIAMVNVGGSNAGDGSPILRLVRGSTAIAIGDSASNRTLATNGRSSDGMGNNTIETGTINWLDSPSTTSATTYTVQFAARGTGSQTAYINRTHNDNNTAEYQRTASCLTLIEVSG